MISCGAAVHHLRTALAALGGHTIVHRIPDPDQPHQLAAVEFGPHDPTDRDVALAATISRRSTDRRRMSSWPVSPDDLTRIAALAQREGAF